MKVPIRLLVVETCFNILALWSENPTQNSFHWSFLDEISLLDPAQLLVIQETPRTNDVGWQIKFETITMNILKLLLSLGSECYHGNHDSHYFWVDYWVVKNSGLITCASAPKKKGHSKGCMEAATLTRTSLPSAKHVLRESHQFRALRRKRQFHGLRLPGHPRASL